MYVALRQSVDPFLMRTTLDKAEDDVRVARESLAHVVKKADEEVACARQKLEQAERKLERTRLSIQGAGPNHDAIVLAFVCASLVLFRLVVG